MKSLGNDAPNVHSTSLNLIGAVLLLAGILIYGAQVYVNQNLLLDDAYITFRYARNLTEGLGLRWNPSGTPTEGFTSMAHVLFLSACARAGLPLPATNLTFLILAMMAASALLFHTLVKYCRVKKWIAAICMAVFITDPNTAMLTVAGLETIFFVLCLVALYLSAVAMIQAPSLPRGAILTVASFITMLCRPDGAIYVFVTLVILALWNMRDRNSMKYVALSAVVLVLMGAGYLLWKLTYFGYLLPNPFYVKSSKLSLSGFHFVKEYGFHLIAKLGPVVLIILCAAAIFRRPFAHGRGIFDHRVVLALIPASAGLAYYLTIMHEVGGFHRFSFPTFFYFIIVVATLWNHNADSLAHAGFHWLVIGAAVFCIIFFPPLHGIALPLRPIPVDGFNDFHFRVAHALAKTGLGPKVSVICDAAGIIPFISRCNHIDRVGLADNYLSGRYPVSFDQRENYIWSRNADFYLGYEPPAPEGSTDAKNDLNAYPHYLGILVHHKRQTIEERTFPPSPELLHRRMVRLRDDWKLIGEIDWPGKALWGLKVFAYVRKASPYRDELRKQLGSIVRPPELACLGIGQ